nr:MAG TPA: holin [Caudoviricetes sp.]
MVNDKQANEAVVDEVFKVAPPVGVSTLSILGVPLPDIIYLVTLIYLLVQIFCTLYKTYYVTIHKTEESKRERKDDNNATD